jgi:SulP family sulfate permease
LTFLLDLSSVITDQLLMVVADGMIIFPASGVFTGLGGMGVSMFFVSCVLLLLKITASDQDSIHLAYP